MPPLTNRQARFCDEYLVDLNACQAAVRAGYSRKTARVIGPENLSKPAIAAAIAERRAKQRERTELSADLVLAELCKIAFANMGDFLKITPAGEPYVDLSHMTRDQAAALRSATVEDFLGGRGDDTRVVRRVKISLHDKRAALVALGRHLGMFPNRHEHTGKDGAQIELVADIRERIAGRIARLAAATPVATGPG
jgi:phage terminase small subunit